MVDYLAQCLLDPGRPRPSTETLLHAFIPAAAVLHTHADAILALTNNRGREKTIRDVFGDALTTVPYRRPGFALSRDVASRFDERAAGIALMNHGLITWGATPREAYDRHVEIVIRAEEHVARPSSAASRHLLPASGEKVLESPRPASPPEQIAPRLRGALCRDRKFILEFDD